MSFSSSIFNWPGGHLQLGDPPTDRGPIIGVPQQDLEEMHAEIERLRLEVAALRTVEQNAEQVQTVLREMLRDDENDGQI